MQFEPNTDYKLVKWIATPNESVSFDTAEKQETTATILNADEQITITPYTVLRDKLSVEFVCDNGTTIPAEKKSYFLNDVFSLSVKPDSDFAFSGFQVINLETNEEDNEIVAIEGNGLDVTVKVLKDNCNAKIVAKTVERPRIVSTTPAYDASGVLRDCKITILFDKLMDNSSIYWTADELTALGAEVNESYKVNGKNDPEGNQYYYAYDTQNGKVYKNITITKLEDDKVNYLGYYGMPEFDKVNPRFLRIPTIKNKEPPASANILVTINSNMLSYNEDGNELTFGETIDIAALNLSDGFYKFIVTGSDVNNNTVTTQEYKFLFDKTPPKVPKIYSGGKENAVDLIFDLRESADVYEINISGADTKTITSPISDICRYKFARKTSNQEYTYHITVSDLCGNTSESTTVVIIAGIRNGMICYAVNNDKDFVFCSNKNFSDITILGVVCDVSEPSKARIWDITEKDATGYLLSRTFSIYYIGSYDSFSDDYKDGLQNYNTALEKYSDSLMSDPKQVFYYVKNEKNNNSPVVWYIPTSSELIDLKSNKQIVNESFSIVRRSIPDAVIQSGELVTPTPYKREDKLPYIRILREGILSTQADSDNIFTYNYVGDDFQERQIMKIHCMAQVDLQ